MSVNVQLANLFYPRTKGNWLFEDDAFCNDQYDEVAPDFENDLNVLLELVDKVFPGWNLTMAKHYWDNKIDYYVVIKHEKIGIEVGKYGISFNDALIKCIMELGVKYASV